MTEYPVQCYNNNGEPYGRYCNPFPQYIDRGRLDKIAKVNPEWKDFEIYAGQHQHPFPSGTIGKTYERNEVEVGWQIKDYGGKWVDAEGNRTPSEWALENYDYRQIFSIAQPVEKEPETVEHSPTYWKYRLDGLQQELRDTLFIRPYNLEEIKKCGVRLCDAIVEFIEKQEFSKQECGLCHRSVLILTDPFGLNKPLCKDCYNEFMEWSKKKQSSSHDQ